MQQTHNKNLNHVHERSEAGRGGSPLRKIEVPCSDDVADSRLRIVGQDVRLSANTSRCIAGHVYPYLCSAECRDNRLLLYWPRYERNKISQNGIDQKPGISAFYHPGLLRTFRDYDLYFYLRTSNLYPMPHTVVRAQLA